MPRPRTPSGTYTVMAEVQKERLLKMREAVGTKLAVQLYGPFIMSFQGVE